MAFRSKPGDLWLRVPHGSLHSREHSSVLRPLPSRIPSWLYRLGWVVPMCYLQSPGLAGTVLCVVTFGTALPPPLQGKLSGPALGMYSVVAVRRMQVDLMSPLKLERADALYM